MEVNRSNYLTVFPEIIEKLERATFVSFDAEYTGMKGTGGEITSLFDDAAQRYEVLRRVVLNNSAPQFGISIFERRSDVTDEQQYTVNAYSFFLSEPCFADFNMSTPKITFEVDCCQFLTKIKFDFQKWLRHSVPYLNKIRLEELRTYLTANPDFMKKCRDQKRPLDEIFFPEYIPTLTDTHINEIAMKLRGFSVLVDVISKRQIPVVGHNMILDLMYFYHQFCADLPVKYTDFKTEVVRYLPKIYDTKFMTVRSRKMLDHPSLARLKLDVEKLKCSGLFVIYKASSSDEDKFSPKFILSKQCQHFQRDLDAGKETDLEELSRSTLCHDPSFDACVTGIVFLNLAHMACRMSSDFLERVQPPSTKEVMFFIRHWEDQLYVARATVMTMCLKGNDPRPNRSWVKVTCRNTPYIDGLKVIRRLKSESDSNILEQLDGVDYRQVSPTEVILAVTHIQCAKDLCLLLRNMGYEASRILIPWDKKRHQSAGLYKSNFYYDTRHRKFFC